VSGYNVSWGKAGGHVTGCFAHARRKLFELADVVSSAHKKSRGQRSSMFYPIALEAVQRLDALFDIERGINGKSPAERLATRQQLSAPLMAELHTWLMAQVAKLSRGHDLTKACFYMLILDNLSSHKNEKAAAILKARGAWFLQPLTPFYHLPGGHQPCQQGQSANARTVTPSNI
jgi:hypothetical protein